MPEMTTPITSTRVLVDVIEQILAVIPEEEAALRTRLDQVRYDCGYTAPEMIDRRWNDASECLTQHLSPLAPIAPEWATAVGRIFSGAAWVERAPLASSRVLVATFTVGDRDDLVAWLHSLDDDRSERESARIEEMVTYLEGLG